MINFLLVAHIAVLGYWLGSELVINSTFRYVSRAGSMPFPERDRLLDHVLDVDQHVRYALILQAGLGTVLAALLRYVPGGNALAISAVFAAGAWLVLVEATHRQRKLPSGQWLASIDNGIRYILIVGLLVTAGAALSGAISLISWFAVKLALFAGVIVCGLGIRLEILRYYRAWHEIADNGSNATLEAELRRRYASATMVLVILWLQIAAIVALSLLRP
ncbi:MAG: hypothetical protein QNJ73_11860 [Gammaproteobacteria bacterium]|nr:hypothetical protein [Gammaproteobacteria bacterium]